MNVNCDSEHDPMAIKDTLGTTGLTWMDAGNVAMLTSWF